MPRRAGVEGATPPRYLAARPAVVPVRRSVTSATLADFVARERDVLEVVVPASRGHVYFRVGEKVYDFSEAGLRVGPVRPIASDRYGFVVRLAPADLGRLRAHLERLERTGGAELGAYDFRGAEGFHCVTWFSRLPIGPEGQTVLEALGASTKDGESMPAFARFLASHVPEQIVYSNTPRDRATLDALKLDIMTLEQLEAAYAALPR
jgi:hypothetical protein